MPYSYRCVNCAREIKQESRLVGLSFLALSGMAKSIITRQPQVFATRSELEKLMGKREQERPYLSLEDYVTLAYNDVNIEFLGKNKASNAQEALRRYRSSYKAATHTMEKTELPDFNESTGEEVTASFPEDSADHKSILEEDDAFTSQVNAFYAAPIETKGSELDNLFHANANTHKKETQQENWDDVELPGFSREAVRQIIQNFRDDERCFCTRWEYREDKGYLYGLDRDGQRDRWGTPDYFVCPHCKSEVLEEAYNNRQVIIGLVGIPKAGKSCLIAAMVNSLIVDQHGSLAMMQKEALLYREEYLNKYKNRTVTPKTNAEGTNCYHPSVHISGTGGEGGTLWTFVDIPGEAFYDRDTGRFAYNDMMNNAKLRSCLYCDTFVLCVDPGVEQNDRERSNTQNTLYGFLRFAAELHQQHPALLVATQVDTEVESPKNRRDIAHGFHDDYYDGELKKEYYRFTQMQAMAVLTTMANEVYTAPITCSAYGFKPIPEPEKGETEHEVRSAWEREYRAQHPDTAVPERPSPRNLDLIFSWIRQINGLEDISIGDDKDIKPIKEDVSKLVYNRTDRTENQVMALCTLFCNPNSRDRDYLDTFSGRLTDKLWRTVLKRRWEREDMKKGIPRCVR